MDRAQMIEALKGLGVDTSLVTDAVPDELLAEMIRSYEALEAPAAEQAPAEQHADAGAQEAELEEARQDAVAQRPANMADGGPPGDPPGEPDEQPQKMDDVTPSKDEMLSRLEGAGFSREDLDQLTDEELGRLYDDEVAGHAQFADPPPPELLDTGDGTGTAAYDEPPPAAPGKDKDGPPAKYSERVVKLSELKDAIAPLVRELVGEVKKDITAKLAATDKQVQRQARESKRQLVRSFCENKRDAGQLPPALVEVVFARLMRADNQRVQKFADASGKVHSMTELERQMAELDMTPAYVSFMERVGQPLPGSDDAEVNRVKNTFRKYSEQLQKAGTTEDKMVAAFKKARERRPGLTAREFTGLE
jgi:hypothetical protein